MKLTTLYTADEHAKRGDDAVANGFYRNDRRIFLPGTGYIASWLWDPTGERQKAGKHVLIKTAGSDGYLSVHYWRDWSQKRSPIFVICPNGMEWGVDCKSSNGDGWKVEGEWPNITCTPSIVAGDYHGFLRDGDFTPDLAGNTWPIPNIPPDYGKPK